MVIAVLAAVSAAGPVAAVLPVATPFLAAWLARKARKVLGRRPLRLVKVAIIMIAAVVAVTCHGNALAVAITDLLVVFAASIKIRRRPKRRTRGSGIEAARRL